MAERTSTNEISADTLQATGASSDAAAGSPNSARINQSPEPGANTANLKQERRRANGVSRDFFDYDIPISDKSGLNGYLELIRRRFAGDYEIDEFGCDPLYGQMWWPLFELLYRNYWRVESTGVDYVPASGRAMIVANHSGGSYAWDAVMISTALHLEHRRPRYVHYVSTEFFYDTPFLSFDNRKKGAALACREDFVRLLERELVVGVFPEGAKGFLKPSDKRYRVQRFGRGGFVQLAMVTRAPIIPVAVVGGEELHFSLGNSRLLANLVNRLIPQERADSFPVLLNMLPLPVKWRIEFCQPIDVSSYGPEGAMDTLLVQQITEQVRSQVQEGLDWNLGLRKTMFW
jgi:1-acyl-sn-glycerol-3-phosphate acyltransferase